MKIELTTSGGLTGRGIGNIAIDLDRTRLTPSERERIASLPVPKPTPSPKPAPDAINYILRIDGQQWSWTDVDAPRDCVAWADALLAIAHRSSSM